jgi:hypothetical protein
MLEKYRDYCQFEYNALNNINDRKPEWFELEKNKDLTIQRCMGAGQCLYFLDNEIDEKEVEKIYYEFVEKIKNLS